MSKTQKTKKIKCGLIMPISAIEGCSETHWEQVRTIIEESLDDTDLSVELVSDADDVGVIQKRIIQNIYDNDMVICDVSCKNPNVMFELGMRLAFDKPAVIIKDDLTPYSFDTSPVEHLTYPRGLHYHQIQDFKSKLRSKVLSTIEAAKKPEYTTFLKHFGKFVVANVEEKPLEKDAYILEMLQDLRQDLNLLRVEQREVSHQNRVISRNMFPKKLPTVEEIVINFIEETSLSPSDSEALKDPKSDLFQALHNEYMNKVVSRSVNPKLRHEQMATKKLLKFLHQILP